LIDYYQPHCSSICLQHLYEDCQQDPKSRREPHFEWLRDPWASLQVIQDHFEGDGKDDFKDALYDYAKSERKDHDLIDHPALSEDFGS